MKAPSELPAAHSMDTTWFAVDADGHVGRFESSENGAVPKSSGREDSGPGGEGAEHLFDDFLLRAVCAARGLVSGTWSPKERWFHDPSKDHACAIVVLRAPKQEEKVGGYREGFVRSSCEDEIPAQGRRILRAEGPRILASTVPLSPGALRRLESHPDVASVILSEQLWWPDEGEPLHGLYLFEHVDYNSRGPGAYDASARKPADPVTVHELPPDVASAVSRVQLPVRFAEVTDVHLADHFQDDECAKWHEQLPLRNDPPPSEPPKPYVRRVPPPPAPRRAPFVRIALALVAAALVLAWWMHR